MHQTSEARWCDAERKRGGATEYLAGGVYVGDIVEDGRVEFHVFEGLAGTVHRNFVVGCTIGVVEGRLRGATLGDLPQIPDRQGVLETPLLGIQGWFLEVQQVEYLAGLRKLALYHEDLIPRG